MNFPRQIKKGDFFSTGALAESSSDDDSDCDECARLARRCPLHMLRLSRTSTKGERQSKTLLNVAAQQG